VEFASSLSLDLDDQVYFYVNKGGQSYDIWEAYKINNGSTELGTATVQIYGTFDRLSGLKKTSKSLWERRNDLQVLKGSCD